MILCWGVVSACSHRNAARPDLRAGQPSEPASIELDQSSTAVIQTPVSPLYGYTYHRADGNRLVSGRGALPESGVVRVDVGFAPHWLVAVSTSNGSIWVAVSEQGRAQAYLVTSDGVSIVAIEADEYVPGQPPLLEISSEGAKLVAPSGNFASEFTHPVVLQTGQGMVWIDQGGKLVLQRGAERLQLEVELLPDARILQDDRGRLLVLSKPTDRYDHGVLGDGLEAGGFILVETSPEFRIVNSVELPGELVIEGIMPIWADINGDGIREIIVTASDFAAGARLLAFSETGEIIAESETIGQGYRWRHQLALAPASDGEAKEIISVRTPHIGGVLEYHRMEGSRLEMAAVLEGVTSHVIGTRNLDLGLVGDFDGDEKLETMLPDSSLRFLVAVERTVDGAILDWTLPLN